MQSHSIFTRLVRLVPMLILGACAVGCAPDPAGRAEAQATSLADRLCPCWVELTGSERDCRAVVTEAQDYVCLRDAVAQDPAVGDHLDVVADDFDVYITCLDGLAPMCDGGLYEMCTSALNEALRANPAPSEAVGEALRNCSNEP